LSRNGYQGQRIGINAIPGAPSVQGAYHSELTGINGVLTIVNEICKLHHITSDMIKMGLDGEEALKQSAGNWLLSPDQADFDMLCNIRAKLAVSPITWQWHWVCGHQDKHVPYHQLDYWARTNMEMDSLAKAFWTTLNAANVVTPNPSLANKDCSLHHGQHKLSHVHKKQLYNLLCEPKAKAYWVDHHHQLTAPAFDNVDWAITGDALHSLLDNQRHSLTKHVTGVCGVCKLHQICGQQTHADCSQCGKRIREFKSHSSSFPVKKFHSR
jgi:hypothetical protein